MPPVASHNRHGNYIELKENAEKDDKPPNPQHKAESSRASDEDTSDHRDDDQEALLPRYSREREPTLLIDDDDDEKPRSGKQLAAHLAWQAFPSLIISVVGLVLAGAFLDEFQSWEAFHNIPELFILVPILLNLKGNLEMNLAARFSTSANLGELDHGPTKRSLIIGNLALLQVQALASGAIAGFASFALGLITKPGGNASTFHESMFMTASAMVSASVSGGLLGIMMVILILVCRRIKVNPDNIACPLASSAGDIVTLLLLAGCALVLQKNMENILSTLVFLIMSATIPFFGYITWRNRHIQDLLFAGWTPLLVAMVISSLAGVVLEKYVEEYKGVALLTPVLIGLAGNLGAIYASRISTSLHAENKENYKVVELTLLLMNVPVQVIFLVIIWAFGMGQLNYNFWFFLAYFLVSMLCTYLSLKVGKHMTLLFWRMGYDPDNYVIPYLTAGIDVVGTAMLVLAFSVLTSSGADDMMSDSASRAAASAS